MQTFKANDGVELKYIDTGVGSPEELKKPLLILLHGFTGSSAVWKRNIPGFAKTYRVVAPDLRGHGDSEKADHGHHVSRLTMDLYELIKLLKVERRGYLGVRVIGASLGAAILWCYSSLFTTAPFSHMIFVDQSPLQNSTLDGWDHRYCSKGMNNPAALAALQKTLELNPDQAYRETIASCLSYRSHPHVAELAPNEKEQGEDEEFFLNEARKGNAEWFGKLMADHTALDWRGTLKSAFNSMAKDVGVNVLSIGSEYSGCFEATGPAEVVHLIMRGRKSALKDGDFPRCAGETATVDWGGHWCYWEQPAKFNELCDRFFVSP